MITLAPDWKDILRRAWSVRLIVLAALLSGAEVIVPLFGDIIPRLPFAARHLGVVSAALVARIVAQRGLDG